MALKAFPGGRVCTSLPTGIGRSLATVRGGDAQLIPALVLLGSLDLAKPAVINLIYM